MSIRMGPESVTAHAGVWSVGRCSYELSCQGILGMNVTISAFALS